MVDLKNICKLCFNNSLIESENDVVCQQCGVVTCQVEEVEVITPKYTVSADAESKLGSSNIVDPALPLVHLNKKFTAKMLERSDVYLKYFSQVCKDLHMPENIARNAYSLFQKLRSTKLGLGKTALFCIVQSYSFANVICDAEQVIMSIKTRFRLKRKITVSQALYQVKPVAMEMKVIYDTTESKALTLKKNVASSNHHKAVQIVDSFSGDYSAQTKSAQEFLDAYGSSVSSSNMEHTKMNESDKK